MGFSWIDQEHQNKVDALIQKKNEIMSEINEKYINPPSLVNKVVELTNLVMSDARKYAPKVFQDLMPKIYKTAQKEKIIVKALEKTQIYSWFRDQLEKGLDEDESSEDLQRQYEERLKKDINRQAEEEFRNDMKEHNNKLRELKAKNDRVNELLSRAQKGDGFNKKEEEEIYAR